MQVEPTPPQTASRLADVLRWIPVFIIAVTILALVAMLLAGGMTKITAWYLLQLLPPLAGLITLIAMAVAWIRGRQFTSYIAITGAAALIALCPLAAWFIPVPYPASLEKTAPAATVRLPADGPLTTAWGGDSISTNYHVVSPDQRWAYDFVVAPYFTNSSNLEDYGCYGIPVVAPVGGLVHDAHDGEPDAVPGAIPNNIATPKGNYVVIRLETGTYLLIAHLKPGSVAVKTGDMVSEGQPIGQCGNSGNTSEPHIHIHHQRQDPSLYPVGFAEGLPLYFRDHDGNAMPVGGYEIVDSQPVATGDVVTHTGK